MSLDEAQRRTLLAVARDALEAVVCRRTPHPVPGEVEGVLGEDRACFVTLYAGRDLRGCIGNLEARSPLSQVVRSMAEAAAMRDPRFSPVTPEELSNVRISLSVLSPVSPIDGPEQVEVGVHGLVVSRGTLRGVLLPQVARDRKWDHLTFLSQTCVKAGLPPDAWQDPETTIEVFSADVFGEPS